MNGKTIQLCCLGFFAGIACHAIAQSAPVLPRPEHAVLQAGRVDLSHGIAFSKSGEDADAILVAAYLKDLLHAVHGPVLINNERPNTPRLHFVHRPSHPTDGRNADESYDLTLTPKEIRITAGSYAGYLYGATSLWQILSHAENHVGAWQIKDAPRFQWRGIMLDSARHMQSEASILQLLDYMAQHKLNVLHWHLTDDQGWRLEIKRYPLLTSAGAYRPQTMPVHEAGSTAPTGPYGGFYTQDQVRRIVAYAKARNITVVPEIEMPGHATAAIVAYPQLGSSSNPLTSMPVGWGIYPNLFNPTPENLAFLQNILLEVMELFPSEYIHLGGDEAIKEQWKSNPAVQQKIHDLELRDENALQGWFMAQMEIFLNKHGRKMVGWDEILEGGISKSATIMSWRGIKGGIEAAKSGHDAILTPSRPLYFNYRQAATKYEPAGRDPVNSLADVYNFQPMPDGLTSSEAKHILGVQGSIWTEYILGDERLQHMLFPRAAALAELAWSPAAGHDFQDFLSRLPADNLRATEAGMHPARTVFAVNIAVQPGGDGKHATVKLETQAQSGSIHYTADGAKVTSSSTAYHAPFEIAFPTTIHTQAFVGDLPAADANVQTITLASSLERDSRVLDPCQDEAGIQMEQDPIRNSERPVFRVVFSHPCWIYRQAPLSLFHTLTLSVGSIPYIFHAPGKTIPAASTSPTTTAHIAIYLDACGGKLLANAPLQSAYRKDGVVQLPEVMFDRQQGAHDLCLRVEDADPATVWLLHTVQPDPSH
jgi:hexosaminidase